MDIFQSNFFILNQFSDKMVLYGNMLGFGMHHWIFWNVNFTCVITKHDNWFFDFYLHRFQQLFEPNNVWTIYCCSNIFCFFCGLRYTIFLFTGPWHQSFAKKDAPPLVLFLSSMFLAQSASVNTFKSKFPPSLYHNP